MEKKPILPITAEQGVQRLLVESIAEEYGFTMIESEPEPEWDWLLVMTRRCLELRQLGKGAPGPIFVDFVTGKNAHRRQFGGGRNQPLAKAVGLKKGQVPSVLDATAGMGKDAFVLASLGCRVQLVERSPVIAALLEDGINRALLDTSTEHIARLMNLVHQDSIEFLNSFSESQVAPDVIYMDPMYPHSKKSAQVKKDMHLFRLLVGEDLDAGGLLHNALKVANKRVVVKRPAKSGPLAETSPHASSSSPNTRYDIYLRGDGK